MNPSPRATKGDVDENGDVVDQALLERLRREGAGGASGVDLDEHLLLVARAVGWAKQPRPRQGRAGWLPGGTGG